MEVHPRELPMVLGSQVAKQGVQILLLKGRTGKLPKPCTVTRSCAQGRNVPRSSLCFCPVLRPVFANPFAFILVIILADLLALEVSFPAKKEAFNLELIKALKSGLNLSLSSFTSSFTRLE